MLGSLARPESAPYVQWTVDADGVMLNIAGTAIHAMEIPAEQVIGGNIRDVYRDSPKLLGIYERVTRGEIVRERLELNGGTWQLDAQPHYRAGVLSGVTGVAFLIEERPQGARPSIQYVRAEMPWLGAKPGDYLVIRPDHPTTKLMICTPAPAALIPAVLASDACDPMPTRSYDVPWTTADLPPTVAHRRDAAGGRGGRRNLRLIKPAQEP